jgi:hypothetical protein
MLSSWRLNPEYNLAFRLFSESRKPAVLLNVFQIQTWKLLLTIKKFQPFFKAGTFWYLIFV